MLVRCQTLERTFIQQVSRVNHRLVMSFFPHSFATIASMSHAIHSLFLCVPDDVLISGYAEEKNRKADLVGVKIFIFTNYQIWWPKIGVLIYEWSETIRKQRCDGLRSIGRMRPRFRVLGKYSASWGIIRVALKINMQWSASLLISVTVTKLHRIFWKT